MNGTTAGGSINVQATNLALSTSAAQYTANSTQGAGGDILVSANISNYTSGSYSVTGITGGNLTFAGNEIKLAGAQLDASGTNGGGNVHVGGLMHGAAGFSAQGIALANATNVMTNSSVSIKADGGIPSPSGGGLGWGNGGEVVLWSDQAMRFKGVISAKGGALGGNGGMAEISGLTLLGYGGLTNLSASYGLNGTLLLDPRNITIIPGASALASAGGGGPTVLELLDPTPGAGEGFGGKMTELTNGNIVIASPLDSFAALNAGAVYLYSSTGVLISTLTGSVANDQVGVGGVTALTGNGNYVVSSLIWNNGVATIAGAATWCSGTAGCVGVVSAANSLVGSTAGAQVGISGITALSNGNYVVGSYLWNNGTVLGVGAATWGNGLGGTVGAVSATNSLVGSTASDYVGFRITALSNGNYVVGSTGWDTSTGVINVGAATWGNGLGGTVGAVSATNSLVGSTAGDVVDGGGIIALSNGNYVVGSPQWDNGTVIDAGAATWCSGTAGCTGMVFATNSLVGSTAGDGVGTGVGAGVGGITALSNGNYVVDSPNWNNGAVSGAGAATWCNGTTGCTGAVSAANSLVGSTAVDQVGIGGITALSNGNYVVGSYLWDNGTVINVGAATWGNGLGGTVGAVSAANSLVGSTAGDGVGDSITALTNGNYVVGSQNWGSAGAFLAGKGAATWCNGLGGTVGAVSAANSLVGSTTNDLVGNSITALSNGNYVVGSYSWDNGAVINVGAATWGNGLGGTVGAVSATNSLVGSTAYDQVNGITALSNGNYVVNSPGWDNGAVINVGAATWCNGTTGCTGAVSAANSLVGSTAYDHVGLITTALTNGNYVVRNEWWDNGAVIDAGAATWGNGLGGTAGVVSASNSLLGSSTNEYMGSYVVALKGTANLGNAYVGSAGRAFILGATVTGTPATGTTFADTPATDVTIGAGNIAATLNLGTNVVLQANNDITQQTGAGITATGAGNLTMQAGRSVMLNDVINIKGALNITANDPGAIAANRAAGTAVLDTSLATLTASAINLTNSGGDILAGAMTASTGAINLTASNNISVAAAKAITATAAGMGVTLNANSDALNGGNIQMNTGSSIVTNGGNITLGGGLNPLTTAAVGSGTTLNNIYGIYLVGATLNAGAGNISLRGTGVAGTTTGAEGIYVTGTSLIQTNGLGTIILNGTGGAGTNNNNGVRIGTSSTITSVNGAISLIGQGGASTGLGNYGVYIHNGAVISATGAGGITLNGIGGAGTTDNYGVYISAVGGPSAISSVNGAISITGQGGAGTGSWNVGVYVRTGATITSTGTGAITLNGTGGAGTTDNYGVRFSSGMQITSVNGAVSITGQGAGTGLNNYGLIMGGGGAAVTSTGAANITLGGRGAGTAQGIYTSTAGTNNIIGGATSTGNITLIADTATGADSIFLSGLTISGTGNLLLEPLNAATTIGLAGGAGTFNLAATELAAISNGFASVTIGRANGTGLITFGDGAGAGTGYTFNANTVIQNPGLASGGISITDPLSTGLKNLTLNSGGSLNVNDAVSANTFTLSGGTWNQVAAVLPGFTVNDFRITGGTFIRALGGNGTIATPYLLTDIYGVQGMGSAGMLGNSYVLANNIDATGTVNWNAGAGFVPVGDLTTKFTGAFDGLGHTITNLTINRPAQSAVGLFGYTNGGGISNVGLVGGSVTGAGWVGGLVGRTGTGSTIINNSYSTGSVTGASVVGGLVGYLFGGTITNSYSTGSVTNAVGSIAGGLVGSNGGTITNSYSTGAVTGGTGWYVGGLVGANNGIITNSYATGAVSGTTYVGGLVGYNALTITNSYATGAVTGTTNVGGLVGWDNNGIITNSYWDTQTSGKANCVGLGSGVGCTGLTTAQMMTMSSFTNWSIANTGGAGMVWRIYEGQTTPLLTSFLTPLTVTANAATKTYDGLAYSGGSGVIYSVAGPALSGALAYGGTSQGAVNAGSYVIAPTGLFSGQQGYDISYVNGALTVNTAPLTVTANVASKTYDGLAYSGGNGVVYNGFVNSETSAVLGGTLAYGGTSQGAVNAGSYLITPSGLTSGNYTIGYVSGNLSISAAAPVASAPVVSTPVVSTTGISEIVNTSLLLGTPDTGSAQSTTEEQHKPKLEEVIAADTSAGIAGNIQALPMCN